MNKLQINNEVRITSVELCKIINQFRLEEGNKTEKRHDVLLRDIRNEIKAIENAGIEGVHNFVESTYINSQSKEQPCFAINRDGTLQILNKESALVRYKTIQYINKLENTLMQQQSIEQQKANLLLDIYNGGQNGVLASKKLTEIEVGEATRPLITIIDTAINDNGLFDIGVIGKMLKPYCKEMGTNKIFEFLRKNKILKNKPGTQKHNNPYDKYCNYFEMKNTYYYIGCERNTHIKTYFNGKGLKWFLKKLAKEEYIEGSQIENIGSKIKNMGEEVI